MKMSITKRLVTTLTAFGLFSSLAVGFGSQANAETVDDYGAIVVVLHDDDCSEGLSGSIGSSRVSVSKSPFTSSLSGSIGSSRVSVSKSPFTSSLSGSIGSSRVSVSKSPFTGTYSGSIGSSRVSVSKSPFTGTYSGSVGSSRVSLSCGSPLGGGAPVTPPAPAPQPQIPQPTAPEIAPAPVPTPEASQPAESGSPTVVTDPSAIAAALAVKPTPSAIYGFPSAGGDIPPQPNAHSAARKGKQLRVWVRTNASDRPVQVPQVTIRVYDTASSSPRCERTYLQGETPPEGFVCNWKFPWGERNYGVYAVASYDGGYIAQPLFRMPDMIKRWW